MKVIKYDDLVGLQGNDRLKDEIVGLVKNGKVRVYDAARVSSERL